MKELVKYVFLAFWVVVLVVLLLFSLVFKDTNNAIVAQVEPVKQAISYQKAVRVLELYALPGQKVMPGDPLVKVERPDLVLEIEHKKNQLERLRIDKLVLEKKLYEKTRYAGVKKDIEIKKLDTEIERFSTAVESNKILASQFGMITGYTDSVNYGGKSYYDVRIQGLVDEKKLIIQQYEQEKVAAYQLYEEEKRSAEILEIEISHELNSLLDEEKRLIAKADFTGTIGSVNVQVGELLPPYTTVLSIYQDNPTLIRAIMHEAQRSSLQVGQKVRVESSNRYYKTEGEITEIGSRIIEYPNRLKSMQEIPMYGRELFIKIPEGNKFLNGERVFVKVRRKGSTS